MKNSEFNFTIKKSYIFIFLAVCIYTIGIIFFPGVISDRYLMEDPFEDNRKMFLTYCLPILFIIVPPFLLLIIPGIISGFLDIEVSKIHIYTMIIMLLLISVFMLVNGKGMYVVQILTLIGTAIFLTAYGAYSKE